MLQDCRTCCGLVLPVLGLALRGGPRVHPQIHHTVLRNLRRIWSQNHLSFSSEETTALKAPKNGSSASPGLIAAWPKMLIGTSIPSFRLMYGIADTVPVSNNAVEKTPSYCSQDQKKHPYGGHLTMGAADCAGAMPPNAERAAVSCFGDYQCHNGACHPLQALIRCKRCRNTCTQTMPANRDASSSIIFISRLLPRAGWDKRLTRQSNSGSLDCLGRSVASVRRLLGMLEHLCWRNSVDFLLANIPASNDLNHCGPLRKLHTWKTVVHPVGSYLQKELRGFDGHFPGEKLACPLLQCCLDNRGALEVAGGPAKTDK